MVGVWSGSAGPCGAQGTKVPHIFFASSRLHKSIDLAFQISRQKLRRQVVGVWAFGLQAGNVRGVTTVDRSHGCCPATPADMAANGDPCLGILSASITDRTTAAILLPLDLHVSAWPLTRFSPSARLSSPALLKANLCF